MNRPSDQTPDQTPDLAGDPESVDAHIARMYGPVDLRAATGLVHVAAVAGPRWEVIRIGPDSPASLHDRFALELCRARADAIVVTGKILRDEPDLRYDLALGLDTLSTGLHAWRRERMGKVEPPTLLVLTSGRGLDPGHPALSADSWARPLVFTSRDAELPPLTIECARVEAPSLAAAVAFLRDRGAKTVALEAGPGTTAPSYRGEHPVIDELLLSRYGGDLDGVPVTDAFTPPKPDGFLRRSHLQVDEPSGPWSFSRWVRALAVAGLSASTLACLPSATLTTPTDVADAASEPEVQREPVVFSERPPDPEGETVEPAATTRADPSDEDEREAKELFMRGVEAFEFGDTLAALEHFTAAYELVHLPALLFNMAHCLEQLGRSLEACEAYRELAASDDSMRAVANERITQLGC